MPVTKPELIEKLNAAIAVRSSYSDPVGGGRKRFLEHVRDIVERDGFPIPEESKLDVCSMPYVFQELNYDGFDWSLRTEDFGHLSDIVDIDVIVWSGGKTRHEITDKDFEDYNRFCHNAITYRSRR
jgi:hypothetical protein